MFFKHIPVLVALQLSFYSVLSGAPYGKAPLVFEANRGQFDARAQFAVRAPGYNAFVTSDGLVVSLGKDSVTLRMEGAQKIATPRGLSTPQGYSNYFMGSDPAKWVRHAEHFEKVAVPGIYKGIDLIYYGHEQQLEYDLEVAPGASTRRLRLRVEGAESLALDESGNLVIHTESGDLVEHKPVAAQEGTPVEASYRVVSRSEVAIRVGRYDAQRALTIDPVITYSTFLTGSQSDTANAIAVDSSGNAYITGEAISTNFPGAVGPAPGDGDVFVSKLNASGTALIYSVYIGGTGTDIGMAIAVDASGNAYLTGTTNSTSSPGGFPLVGTQTGSFVSNYTYSFATKLNASGDISYSRSLGGSQYYYYEASHGIAVDSSGNAYIAGQTESASFPTTVGSLKPSAVPSQGTGFIVKLDNGGVISYATYLGGSQQDSANAIAIDGAGNAYVAGETNSIDFPVTANAYQRTLKALNNGTNAFVCQLNPSGSALVFSTFLGGSGADVATGLQADALGDVYLTGLTNSSDFPTSAGAFSTTLGFDQNTGFVAKLTGAGQILAYGTYLGGSGYDTTTPAGIAVDASGTAYVGGQTTATGFPTTPGAVRDSTSFTGGNNLFFAKLNPSGSSLTYSTLVGTSNSQSGSGETGGAIALDAQNAIYLTGQTQTATFPVTAGAAQTTLEKVFGYNITSPFVVKIDNSTTVCNIVPSAGSVEIPAIGSSATFTFTATPGCPWEVSNLNGWITLNSPISGFGNGSVSFTAGYNENTSSRAGSVALNGGVETAGANLVNFTQDAGSCSEPRFTPSSLTFDPAGGIENVSVEIPSQCPWNLVSTVPWISVNSAAQSGPGTLTLTASVNSFSSRVGSLTIGSKAVSLAQGGGSCTISLGASSAAIASSVSTGSVSLTTTGSMCQWFAATETPWIQIQPSSASGIGNGAVPYTVAANPSSSSRTGSILIGNQDLQVTQSAGPGYIPLDYTVTPYSSGYYGSLGDGGPVSGASFNQPAQMSFDAQGNLYIADTGDFRIRVVNTSGIIQSLPFAGPYFAVGDAEEFPPTVLEAPTGVAVDQSGHVFVADSSRIQEISGNVFSTFAGNGSTAFNGDNQQALQTQMAPSYLVFDASGNLFFSDKTNNRIRKIATSGIVTTVAGTGTAGYSGDGGSATLAELSAPNGLAIDSLGNLFVADIGNNVVREISVSGTISTLAGEAHSSVSSGDGGLATAATFSSLEALAVDAAGAVYVADNQSIRKVLPNGVIVTVVQNAPYYFPTSLAADSLGNILGAYGSGIFKLIPNVSTCRFAVTTPAAQPSSGGMLTLAVTASPGCAITGVSNVSWISYAGETTSFTVAPNTIGAPRTGSITFGDQLVAVNQAASGPPSVFIDVPAPNASISGLFTISGWAIDNTAAVGSAIASVQLAVDGAVVGMATYGTSRPDVCGIWPERPGCPNVGYTYLLNTASLSQGPHTITVTALNTDLTPGAGSATVNVNVAMEPSVWIDVPAANAPVSGVVTLSGWAIDNTQTVGSAISSVQVRVDGTVVGNATYGTSRPDVCNLWPGRPNCPNVGYTFALNTALYTSGPHTITVSATNTDATPHTGVASETVIVEAGPSVWIDAPAANASVSDVVTISGWAIDNVNTIGTAISNVQVLVDGVVVGNATYGTSRPDVCDLWPGRANCPNVGYTYSLNTATLSTGPHTITVSATNSDATPSTSSATVHVTVSRGPTVWIDTPAANSPISGVVTVAGWAIDNINTIGTPVSMVEVKVDGAVVGNATYGTSRPDVCSIWPGRPNCPNVGYTYSLNTATLGSGPHVITVSATNTDPTPSVGSVSVNVVLP